MNSVLVILGYLSGSVISAILACRLPGLEDPREMGPGNPGVTNTYRLYGRQAAVLTLAGDLLKSAVPVFIARVMDAPDSIIATTGMAAFP